MNKKNKAEVRRRTKIVLQKAALKHSSEVENLNRKLIEKDTEISKLNEVAKNTVAIVANLNSQLESSVQELEKKSDENILLSKKIGQVNEELTIKSEALTLKEKEYSKLVNQNDAFSKQYNVIQDENEALRLENIQLQKQIIDYDSKLSDKKREIEEKDDLIKYLKTPWYRRIFKRGTI